MGEKLKRWVCPYCDKSATMRKGYDFEDELIKFNLQSEKYAQELRIRTINNICPNPKCRLTSVVVSLDGIDTVEAQSRNKGHGYNFFKYVAISLLPYQISRKVKSFNANIPAPIISDYEEACSIVELSPKAAATLARRALQGMIRDFWEINERTLYQEINKLKSMVDPTIWEAIDGLREMGNIGAHMEQDVNLIIDIDPDETEMLIELIEILLEDWYVQRERRQKALLEVKSLADRKKKEIESGKFIVEPGDGEE